MAANKVQLQPQKWAMSITSTIVLEKKRFKMDERDKTCTSCNNGLKSIMYREISGKRFPVEIICTCVPYTKVKEENGDETVVYKGREEFWPKGKRSEQSQQNELIRKQAVIEAATKLKNTPFEKRMEVANKVYDELKQQGLTDSEINAINPQSLVSGSTNPINPLKLNPVLSRNKQGLLQYTPSKPIQPPTGNEGQSPNGPVIDLTN